MGDIHEMSIESWGPKIWSILHITSFSYPSEPTVHDKHIMYNFYHSLKHLLPCPRCKTHFAESLQYHMNDVECETLQSRRNLSYYVVELHNEVNKRNGKEEWSYERAEGHYCADRSGVCTITPPPRTSTPTYTRRENGWGAGCLNAAIVSAAALALFILTARLLYLRNKKVKW